MAINNAVIKKFKERGVKLTPQRLAILNSLDGDTSHPGITDIYARLKSDYPSLSMTTVYNTLEMLKVIGEVVEVTVDKQRIRYDPDTSMHDHIICMNCRKVGDVPAVNNANLLKKRIKGYKLLGVSNQYYGICKKCQ